MDVVQALESIQTQTDDFGRSLENMVNLIFERIESNDLPNRSALVKDPVLEQIQKIIFNRTGLNIHLKTNHHLAAVLPFHSNRNGIFVQEWWKQNGQLNIPDQTKFLNQFSERKGSVNLDKAKVSGVFSEYKVPVYINFFSLKEMGFTPPEVTAILLHELGHAFYICYYADRADQTNQVLASIARHNFNREKGDIDYLYRELNKIDPSKAKEMSDTLLNGPRVVAGAKWFQFMYGVVRSQLNDPTYSKTSFEERADNFASRFGYGKEITIALDKLSAGLPEKSKSMVSMLEVMNAMSTVALGFFAVMGFFIGAAGILFGIYFSLLFFCLSFLSREDTKDYTYDDLKFRYLRIRQDVIDQLKDPELDKKVIAQYIEDIRVMDEVIKNTKVPTYVSRVIANLLFSRSRQTRDDIKDQQRLEFLANSDLFLKSAELRLSASK